MVQVKVISLILAITVIAVVSGKIFFKEEFETESWQERWIESKFKGDDQGKWKWSAGKFYNDAEKDKGLQTSQDAKFYGISAKFQEKFSNEGKNLVIQFTVKHEQGIDCGGGYVKVMASDIDQPNFHGETPYHIMFGPDICGMTKKVHVIFTYKGKNHLIKKEISCKDDELSHVYTLVVKPDNTYEVHIDLEKKESGSLEDDWEMLQPKKIKDPKAKKPEDWVDEEKIDDPADKKPEDWDKPKTIPDPNAKKPDDWDEEMDGEWEPAKIDNPEYKGEWKPKQIDNPKYKGQWIHPEIDNPDFKPDATLYQYSDIGSIGFDLWQVKSGTIFDNIIVTDSIEEAKKHAEETWKVMKEGEKKMKDKADEEDRKKREKEEEERKKKEEAEKAAKKEEEPKKTEDEKKTDEEKKDDASKKDEKHASDEL